MSRWTLADLPPQRAKLAIVTGASPGGLGYETALALAGAGAGAGASVVLTARDPAKGEAARQRRCWPRIRRPASAATAFLREHRRG